MEPNQADAERAVPERAQSLEGAEPRRSHNRLYESQIRLPVEEPEPLSPPWTKPDTALEFCAVTLNIGGRNTNPVEFVLEGDETGVGTATAALGTQMLEAMSSDISGPSSLGEAERRAVDSVLADLGNGADIAWVLQPNNISLLDQPTWARLYDLVTESCQWLSKLCQSF